MTETAGHDSKFRGPRGDHLARVMERAVVKPRGNGRWMAYLDGAVHVACADGADHASALAALREEVAANWLAVLRTLKTILGREAC